MRSQRLQKAEILVTAIVGMIGLRADDRSEYKQEKTLRWRIKRRLVTAGHHYHAAGKGIWSVRFFR